MRNVRKLGLIVALGGLLPLSSCAVDVRDAVIFGALDFISTQTGDLLNNVLAGQNPLGDAAAQQP